MAKRTTLQDLNNLLFEMAERLVHPEEDDKPVDHSSIHALCKIAEVVIDSGRAHTEFLKAMDQIAPGSYDGQAALPKSTLFLGYGK